MKKSLIFMIITMVIGIFFNIKSINAESINGDQYITSVTVTDSQGKPLTELNKNDTAIVNWNLTIPGHSCLHTDDILTLDIPNQLKPITNLTFNITDKNGEVIAKGSVDKNTNKIKLKLTDYIDSHNENPINMKIQLYLGWNQNIVNVGTTEHLIFGNGYSTNLTVGKGDDVISSNQKFVKFGKIDKNNPSIIHWTIRINYAQVNMENVILTDYCGNNQELDINSFKARYVKYTDNKGNYTVIKKVPESLININALGFQIHFGDLKESVLITYDTKNNDNGESQSYTNHVMLSTSNNYNYDLTVKTPHNGVNGTGNGNLNSSSIMGSTNSSSTMTPSSITGSTNSSSTMTPSSIMGSTNSSSIMASSSITGNTNSSSTMTPSSIMRSTNSSSTVASSSITGNTNSSSIMASSSITGSTNSSSDSKNNFVVTRSSGNYKNKGINNRRSYNLVLPQTGDNFEKGFSIVGIIFLITTGILVLYKRKQN